MAMWLPDEFSDERDARGEPEPTICESGLSPLCTDEPSTAFQGEYVCGYCRTFLEQQIAAGGVRTLTEAENLWARR